jgi:hypothetical protein
MCGHTLRRSKYRVMWHGSYPELYTFKYNVWHVFLSWTVLIVVAMFGARDCTFVTLFLFPS